MYAAVYYRLAPLLLLLSTLSGCALYDHIFHPYRLGSPPMTASARAKAKAAEKARHKGLTLGTPAPEGAKSGSADGGVAGAGADVAAPAPPSPADDARAANDKNKAIEDMLGNTYNTKTGLLKRSKLQRMQYSGRQLHHYSTHPLAHTEATRDARRLRKHPKPGKGKAAGPKVAAESKAAEDTAPAPDPTQPAAKPTKTAARPAKAAPKPKVASRPKATPAKTKPAPAAAEPAGEPAPTAKPPKFKQAKKDKKAPKAPKRDPTQPLNGDQ